MRTKTQWLPNAHFAGVFEYEYNDVDLREGQFETRLLRIRTDVALSTDWAWITTAQYDNQSDVLGVNSRLQWIPKAGTEFYIIYNGGWIGEGLRGFQTVGRSATIRIQSRVPFLIAALFPRNSMF